MRPRARSRNIKRIEQEQPAPKTWDELNGGAREALRSFLTFAEMFLLRPPVPWRETPHSEYAGPLLSWERPRSGGCGQNTAGRRDMARWLDLRRRSLALRP